MLSPLAISKNKPAFHKLPFTATGAEASTDRIYSSYSFVNCGFPFEEVNSDSRWSVVQLPSDILSESQGLASDHCIGQYLQFKGCFGKLISIEAIVIPDIVFVVLVDIHVHPFMILKIKNHPANGQVVSIGWWVGECIINWQKVHYPMNGPPRLMHHDHDPESLLR